MKTGAHRFEASGEATARLLRQRTSVGKALLLSILLALVMIPLLAAQHSSGTRAMKKTLLLTLLFSAFYLFALRFLYSRLS